MNVILFSIAIPVRFLGSLRFRSTNNLDVSALPKLLKCILFFQFTSQPFIIQRQIPEKAVLALLLDLLQALLLQMVAVTVFAGQFGGAASWCI